MVGRWVREPLVHFLVIGTALFLLVQWSGGGPDGRRIVVTPGRVDALAATFARTWQRPPTERELQGLIQDYVREEIATREAMAMGLDRDDAVIRRRLRQKLEFMVDDVSNAIEPTDAELQAWLDAHPDAFAVEPQAAFRQVYLSPDRRGQSVDGDAQELLAKLVATGPSADVEPLGDSLLLPQELELTRQSEIARLFGSGFAAEIMAVETGRWAGPIRSGYGLHLVFVLERRAGRPPDLAEVRPLVEREFLAARRERELDAMYERLRDDYQVVMDVPGASAGETVPSGEAVP